MSRALAIETSGRIGSVALVEDARVLVEEQFPHGLKHAATVVPMIDRLCAARGWKPGDLKELYVSAGPGSFTGLRIGITLAKAMSLATGVKIVAVPTVNVLALNAPAEARHLIIVLDAKRDQIFTARFDRESDRQPWQTGEEAHVDSLAQMIERSPRPVWLLGEGIPYHQKFLTGDESVLLTPAEMWRARASAVAQLGLEMSARGEFADPDKLIPIYIRRPEAEEKFEARAGQSSSSGNSAAAAPNHA